MVLIVHYDNVLRFEQPYLFLQYAETGEIHEFSPAGKDGYGSIYELTLDYPAANFKFKDGPGDTEKWEDQTLDRSYQVSAEGDKDAVAEIWCRGHNAFVYTVEPRLPEKESALDFLKQLNFKDGFYVPEAEVLSGLGANLLADGRVEFGLFHPHAARVYLTGSFNDWQHPGLEQPEPEKFIELKLYRGYFDLPNLWLVVTDRAKVRDEYKFFIQGGVPTADDGLHELAVVDPYARQLCPDYAANNAIVADPTRYRWEDGNWHTPAVNDLIIYELHMYGFTMGTTDITPEHQGKFTGVIDRIKAGYLNNLGVTALSVMPLNEVSTPQGSEALGYNPSLFFAIERDFGIPDECRAMVDIAHQHGLAVIVDQVFNHADNGWNPLWKLVLDHPAEEGDPAEGGLYFSGSSPWGNRLSTERIETQNLLIDACKLLVKEYHMDGFRFDFTHSSVMDHGFLNRLADDLQAFKPDVILIAENMPNEADLNREGFNGFAQWSNDFHDKIKALLREGEFEGQQPDPDGLNDIFYFSKLTFASHTNNVVNYCENHDEHSVAHEVSSVPGLDTPAAKERKSRLGLFSTVVALGQPMIYMGQEFDLDRPRNQVMLDWPADPGANGFYQWSNRLIRLRRRYPALRLAGFDPAKDGQFSWILGPWLDEQQGGGQKIIGWRAQPTAEAYDALVVLLNFENHPVEVEVDFGIPGVWVRLADIDVINDIPPEGTNSPQDVTAIRTSDGKFGGFQIPDSSGFIYKWEANA
ncbi:MAG: 1,4-alpha-glucan branching protein [Chloroflexi bacterium]|nr:1,4-alpha-glucan branching protein [Chloroflexota bacterium]